MRTVLSLAAILFAASASVASQGSAGAPNISGPIIDPLHLGVPVAASATNATNSIFNDLVNYFSQGVDEAETLSIAVPSIQDGNGHDCAVAAKTLMSVLKVHPDVISGHAAADVEGLRVTIAAFHQICDNVACQKVFSEAANAVATLGVGVTVPIFPAFCAKLPAVSIVPPAATDAPTPTPTGTKQ